MSIILIDDNTINLTLLKHLVDQIQPNASLSFTEPEAALAHCAKSLPDLIIVDYMMPVMDGIEFIRQFRKLPGRESIPVVMVTAIDEASVRYEALTAGANDFLNKPIDKIEFMARMRNMLALRSAQKRLEDKATWLAEEVLKATEEIVQRERETIHRLSRAAEYRDPETGAHILRMARYSWLIAMRMKLSKEDQDLILEAAPMHDIGKVGTPDHILLKPGKLDPEEFEIMKEHARIGHEILSNSKSPLLLAAAEIALSHHEKFNGSGYPQGLKGSEIPLFGRIVAVADVFDALTSARPYKVAWEIDRAVAFMKENSGSHFDPECIDLFLKDFDQVLSIRNRFKDAPGD